jgi:LacI family transcriptional regulator
MPLRLRPIRVLLLVETSRAYGRHLIEGIGRYAREDGQWSLIFEERGVEELMDGELGKGKADGVISRLKNPQAARRLQRSGIPFVELHGDPKTIQPHITVDESAVAHMAAEHFLHLGLKTLGFFSRRDDWWLQHRRNEFVARAASLGFACEVLSSPQPQSKKAAAAHQAQRELDAWLRSIPKPIGILCATDLEALALLEACRRESLSVPDQVAVLGVDNDSAICSVAWPRLSSIDLDAQRIGYEASALLARFMGGAVPDGKTLLIPPKEVVARESTDVLAIADTEVVKAVRLIRQFACKGIAVSHVADRLAMCRRTLERRFKDCLGYTIKEEITRVRIEHAKMLLRSGQTPIKRVSHLCGFSSQHYFTRAFASRTGKTPARFRIGARS